MLAVDGEQRAAAAALGGEGELAGRDEALLVREREVDAVLERPERRADSPAKPTTAFSTRSGLRASSSSVEVAAGLVLGPVRVRERATSVAPDATAQSVRSGCASMISIAWRPIEPVAPRSAIRFIS